MGDDQSGLARTPNGKLMLDWLAEAVTWLPLEYLPGRYVGPIFIFMGICVLLFSQMHWLGGGLILLGILVTVVSLSREGGD